MPDGNSFNMTVYLKGGPIINDGGYISIAQSNLSIFSTVVPLLLMNVNAEIK
jgi:hypothetical protein